MSISYLRYLSTIEFNGTSVELYNSDEETYINYDQLVSCFTAQNQSPFMNGIKSRDVYMNGGSSSRDVISLPEYKYYANISRFKNVADAILNKIEKRLLKSVPKVSAETSEPTVADSIKQEFELQSKKLELAYKIQVKKLNHDRCCKLHDLELQAMCVELAKLTDVAQTPEIVSTVKVDVKDDVKDDLTSQPITLEEFEKRVTQFEHDMDVKFYRLEAAMDYYCRGLRVNSRFEG